MKNKNGFTLIELLAVIALLAMLVIFVVPNIFQYIRRGENSLLSLQEKNVEDAAQLYLEDFCKNPINYNFRCPLNHVDENNLRKYFGSLKVDELLYEQYIENVSFKEKDCSEYSYVTYDKNGKITAYLCCDPTEVIENEEIVNIDCKYKSEYDEEDEWKYSNFNSSIGDE